MRSTTKVFAKARREQCNISYVQAAAGDRIDIFKLTFLSLNSSLHFQLGIFRRPEQL